jgi:hypothetical protein
MSLHSGSGEVISCDSIPLEGNNETVFRHLAAVGDPRYFADQGLAYFEPFFYQAMTEIGYYGYDFDKFAGLMKHARNAEKPEFQFSAPQGPEYVYDYEFGQKVAEFIREDAGHFIFLYGEFDPWSATAADPGDNKNCLKVVNKGGAHGTRIGTFLMNREEVIMTKLEEWMDFLQTGEDCFSRLLISSFNSNI